MTNFKKASKHRNVVEKSNQFERVTTQYHKKPSIHKCPVHTLLTSIFSGIAWNG